MTTSVDWKILLLFDRGLPRLEVRLGQVADECCWFQFVSNLFRSMLRELYIQVALRIGITYVRVFRMKAA